MDKRKGYRKKSRRRRRMTVQERKLQLMMRMAAALALILVLAVVLIVRAVGSRGESREVAAEAKAQETEKTAVPEPESTPEPVEITISAAGDCTLGMDEEFDYDTSFNAMYESVGDPSWFFQNVRSIFEADDLTIVNLEGPLTESEDIQEKTFAFKGSPSYVQVLTEGSVEAANLANNHSHDYGERGYEDTIQNVENAGISTFGYDRTALLDVKGVKVGLAGIYVLADGMERQTQLKEKIQELKEQGAQLVIVSFHWGSEKENYPDDTQKSLAHIAIDEGADLVLGHHPHVLQGIETYKGKKIVYSLGNFCFGGNSNPSDRDTMIYQQTFTVTGKEVAEDENITIIPCSISSEPDYNNYQPTPVQGEEKTRIEERIAKYSEGLEGSTE
ncbi:MAG: CapA family protein [Ruminococcus sp.]|jgi:poly-gamma-glutamate capsule biosynthesis protein CapA/YwtB (metallophosphatase superfamily)